MGRSQCIKLLPRPTLCRELGVTAIYSGHDHNNDYAGVLDGVR